MNESEVFNDFLQITLNNFPTRVPTTGSDNEIEYLERDVLYMKPTDSPAFINSITNVTEYDETNRVHQDKLLALLSILDNTLGEKYSKISKIIYENHKPWKDNKLDEMKTPGLIHVSYKLGGEPLLFMSFMLTNEDEYDEDKPCCVIYLYEIQLLSRVRNQGIGNKLLKCYLMNCSKEISSNNATFIGIELTVFSDNLGAIKFYESLGMRLTPWSPQDTVKIIHKRITRGSKNSVGIENNKSLNSMKRVIKPIYYLYYLPINDKR